MLFRQSPWILLGCAVLAASCGGASSTSSQDLTGGWCGTAVARATECQGDEVGYLELAHRGNSVTGIACEAFGKDCMTLQAGRVAGDQFTFYYTFDSFRVDAMLTVGSDTMTGSYYSDKCDCTVPYAFHRLP